MGSESGMYIIDNPTSSLSRRGITESPFSRFLFQLVCLSYHCPTLNLEYEKWAVRPYPLVAKPMPERAFLFLTDILTFTHQKRKCVNKRWLSLSWLMGNPLTMTMIFPSLCYFPALYTGGFENQIDYLNGWFTTSTLYSSQLYISFSNLFEIPTALVFHRAYYYLTFCQAPTSIREGLWECKGSRDMEVGRASVSKAKKLVVRALLVARRLWLFVFLLPFAAVYGFPSFWMVW